MPGDNMENERIRIPPPEWRVDEGYSYGVIGHSLYALSPKYKKAGAELGDVVVSTSVTGDVNDISKAQKALAGPPGTEVLVHRVIDGELWRITLVL